MEFGSVAGNGVPRNFCTQHGMVTITITPSLYICEVSPPYPVGAWYCGGLVRRSAGVGCLVVLSQEPTSQHLSVEGEASRHVDVWLGKN